MKRAADILEAFGEEAAERVARTLEGISRGSRCLVGVSGGADSVCLLHVLRAFGFRHLIVCHLDHGLRGVRSRRDAEWVRQLAARLGVESRSSRVHVATAARDGRSIEEAGRLARHRFFAEVARELRCRRLFLGHHADDRAESLLFHLLRGAGGGGLSTLRARSTIVMDGVEIEVVRPLIAMRAAAIRAALTATGIRWRNDASNASPVFTRNRLRHEAIPLLAHIMGRDVVPQIVRTADILEHEEAMLDALAAEVPTPARLPVASVRGCPVALQRRILKRWLDGLGVTATALRTIDDIRALLAPGCVNACVNLPKALCVRRRRGHLHVEQQGRTTRARHQPLAAIS